jgi:hypothetical protein
MEIKILDTETEQIVTIQEDNVNGFSWCDGNWSCDCNRSNYFDESISKELEKKYGDNICFGSKRFLVVSPLKFKDREERFYTLEDVNQNYPKELCEYWYKKLGIEWK